MGVADFQWCVYKGLNRCSSRERNETAPTREKGASVLARYETSTLLVAWGGRPFAYSQSTPCEPTHWRKHPAAMERNCGVHIKGSSCNSQFKEANHKASSCRYRAQEQVKSSRALLCSARTITNYELQLSLFDVARDMSVLGFARHGKGLYLVYLKKK